MQLMGAPGLRKRILLSILVVLVGGLAATAGLERIVDKTPVARLDRTASDYYDGALKRAFTTYALARMLNGAISAVQGTRLAVSPAGMGMTLSVGEVLDPINDLVERFSWVMLLSTVSLGIQKTLMAMGAWVGFRLMVALAMAVILAGIWIPRAGGPGLRHAGMKLLAAALVVRFCFPLIGVGSWALYHAFLADEYSRSTESLQVIRGRIRAHAIGTGERSAGEEGLVERLREKYRDAKEALNIEARLEALKETVESGIERITDLMVVFVLQTVIIPLAVLWALLRLFRWGRALPTP